jgi:hypothetical protein
VCSLLLRNGIGVVVEHGRVRAPSTVEEVESVLAVQSLLGALDYEARLRGEPFSQSRRKLMKVQQTQEGSRERTEFMGELGLTVLLWLRHTAAHVTELSSFQSMQLSGFSSAVVEELVSTGAAVIAQEQGGAFEVDAEGVLSSKAR